jgi:hypothetical protein
MAQDLPHNKCRRLQVLGGSGPGSTSKRLLPLLEWNVIVGDSRLFAPVCVTQPCPIHPVTSAVVPTSAEMTSLVPSLVYENALKLSVQVTRSQNDISVAPIVLCLFSPGKNQHLEIMQSASGAFRPFSSHISHDPEASIPILANCS